MRAQLHFPIKIHKIKFQEPAVLSPPAAGAKEEYRKINNQEMMIK
jgi:hypothetical protein